MAEPTNEGQQRYHLNEGHYTPGQQDTVSYPCICTSQCKRPCKGNCGCKACDYAWQDFLGKEAQRKR